MKLQGKFSVVLSDGVEQYHANGSWAIYRGDAVIAASIDHEEWSDDHKFAVRDRLAHVRAGDRLEAASATGKTAVSGEIIARAGDRFAVDGEAWGPSHSAYGPKGTVGFRTYTFDVVSRHDCFYSGSLPECVGRRADHELIRRIDAILNPAAMEREPVAVTPKVTPFWQ